MESPTQYLPAVAGVAALLVVFKFLMPSKRKALPPSKQNPEQLASYERGERVHAIERDSRHTIRRSTSGPASTVPITLAALFAKIVSEKGNKVALKYETSPGKWADVTWQQFYQQARSTAKSFIKLGVQPHDSVAILGFNSKEWFLSNWGAIFAGAKSAGIYTTNAADACQYVIEHSGTRVVVVEDEKQLEKILSIRSSIPRVAAIVMYKGTPPATEDAVYSWEEFMKVGADVSDVELNNRVQNLRADEPCSLVYTSGTTGPPKAAMSCHDNLVFQCKAILDTLPKLTQIDNRIVSYLPLSHIAGQLCDMYLPVVATATTPFNTTIYFAQPTALKGTLGDTLKACRPTFFFGVPRVWEKFVEAIKAKGAGSKGLKKKLATWAKGVGLAHHLNAQVGQSGVVPFGYNLANKLVFTKVRQALGLESCIGAFTGAAPISRETLEFMMSLGITVNEVYGMSESTGVTSMTTPSTYKIGSCGYALHGTELRIDHDPARDKKGEGEICFRGRHIMMGYLKNEQKSQEAVDPDGWLHSGDVGRIDQDGFLYITGRIKELIITAGGENIAPVPIEDAIKEQLPALANVMLIGDRKKYNSVLVTAKSVIDPDSGEPTNKLAGEALAVDPGCTTTDQAANSKVWSKYITDGIVRYNNGPTCVSNAQKVQKFKFLLHDFTIPGGELTATLKLKRPVVVEKYADQITELYGE
eukprot:TRINITY_DN103193_c0_g1_i1.p1 TRINITY_DN103193_c0_g1~~TRINITY_DN103193_c0_g1_i1.p1  ORF type:complete len:713 (-),score=106.75 TRINITY_DN103193_c0_g1_i1:133-2232(-)